MAQGDLYDPEATPHEVARAVSERLASEIEGAKAAVVSRTGPTSWTMEIAILESERDLADRRNLDDLVGRMTAVAGRYGYDRSVPEADHTDMLFRIQANVHEDYWSKRQAAAASPDMKPLAPTRFLKELKRGDRLVDRRTGAVHSVIAVSASRFETDGGDGIGRIRWNAPRSAALRSDGRSIRIARGNVRDPDAHDHLDWIRE